MYKKLIGGLALSVILAVSGNMALSDQQDRAKISHTDRVTNWRTESGVIFARKTQSDEQLQQDFLSVCDGGAAIWRVFFDPANRKCYVPKLSSTWWRSGCRPLLLQTNKNTWSKQIEW